MKILKFKTNIKCAGCVEGVTPSLNKLTDVQKWEVDLHNPDRILTVETNDDVKAQEIIDAIERAGFRAEAYIAF